VHGQAQVSYRDSLGHVLQQQRKQPTFQPTDSLYLNTLVQYAKEYRYYNLDSLKTLSEQVMHISEKYNIPFAKANAHSLLGSYHSDKGNQNRALNHYHTILTLCREHDFKDLELKTLGDLGFEYEAKGNYAKALGTYLDALELATEYGNKDMQSILNEYIANLYISQKDFDQAMYFYEKVKKLNEEIGDEIFIAETMSNMASAYADMGELEYAMFHANAAIKTFEEKRILDWLAYAYEIKGKVYLKQMNYKWAMYWYKQSEHIHKELQDERGELDLLNGMAKATFHQDKDSISEQYALKAYDISKKLGILSSTMASTETLYELHKKRGHFETALGYHEIFKAMADTLIKKESENNLLLLKAKVAYDQQKETLIEDNQKALAKQKAYVYASLFVLLVFIIVTFLIKRNEKIQKSLNKALMTKTEDLEKSQAYLKEVNRTKVRLFSIIGHDLRGPIGAVQGLLQLVKDGEVSNEELLQFIPKLRRDMNSISFTLNNLLSWGNSQMNGSNTKAVAFDLKLVVQENIGLLAEIAGSKGIEVKNELQDNTMIWSDTDQIDIVVRNLISNAIKFTPQNGEIIITGQEKSAVWEICVRDTGIGMDEQTLKRIFTEDTHTTYGTNDEKGTGLGLSLCKEMVEKNNGSIWANSTLKVGSTFYFTLPKVKKEYKKSA
jgi:signal transduction histidine kinase